MHTTKSHEELYEQKEHDGTKSYTWKTVYLVYVVFGCRLLSFIVAYNIFKRKRLLILTERLLL